MSRWNLGLLLGAAALTLVGISVSFSAPPRDGALPGKHENLRLLVDVLEEVQHKYVKELDKGKQRELVENMINGGLERLDQHSAFIGPEEFKQFTKQSEGEFGGIGIKIGLDRVGQIFVESPMVGTPAYEAGVLAGDLITKIDGTSTETMSLKKAVELITGEPGQKVTLTVYHEGSKQPTDIEITRAKIHVDSVLGDLHKKDSPSEWDFTIDKKLGIAYVRVVGFTKTTTDELTKVVEQLQKEGIKGLVLDLRNNPGGLLRSAVEVSSLFLPDGKKIVSTRGRNQTEEVYESKRRPGAPPPASYPIAILLNRYSASASEIVASALQDHLRAVIIGERSYGKGSVQNVIPMENNTSALKLTTASYWRPSGKNIHRFPDSKEEDEWGVRPDKGFEVKLPDEERIDYFKWRRERDVIRKPGQPAPKIPDSDKAKEGFKDRVLDKALEHLRDQIQKGNAAVPMIPEIQDAELVLPQPSLAARAVISPFAVSSETSRA